MSMTAPRYQYNYVDEDLNDQSTPSSKSEKDAMSRSSAFTNKQPLIRAQNAPPLMYLPFSIVLGSIGFSILLYLRVASSVFHSRNLSSSSASSTPHQSMPSINVPATQSRSEASSTSLILYTSATYAYTPGIYSPNLNVVSDKTYYFSPEVAHMYFAWYPPNLQCLTTIEAASDGASHVEVDMVWKTYLVGWQPKPADIKNFTDFGSMSFGVRV
ncbi:hypothetical protein FRC02_007990 [Tulasnella sp. 418]|nr:hypothetical protein FRC02_007990 [Tulasnella sp. 418]